MLIFRFLLALKMLPSCIVLISKCFKNYAGRLVFNY